MGVGLTNREIEKVVNDYMGVTEGHFGDFSYSTHADFTQRSATSMSICPFTARHESNLSTCWLHESENLVVRVLLSRRMAKGHSDPFGVSRR
jgi:hypothetical protein